MQRWEYKVERVDFLDNMSERELNELGQNGWELTVCYQTKTTLIYIFKRESKNG